LPIGFMQRTDGSGEYAWREYLMFNPIKGLRWLVEADGHWSYVTQTREKPKLVSSGFRPVAKAYGKTYMMYLRGEARVDYVVGEFHWRVAVGERTEVEDYILPPEMLSMEKSPKGPDGKLDGEVVWSIGQYLRPEEVRAGFGLTGALPLAKGVAPHQPSEVAERNRGIGTLWSWFAMTLLVIQALAMVRAPRAQVYRGDFDYRTDDPQKQKTSPTLEIPGPTDNLELRLQSPVQNGWLEIEGDLVDETTGATYDLNQGVEYYSGVDSDGAWSEGSTTGTQLVSTIPPGRYHLNLTASAAGPAQPYSVVVTRGVLTWSNFFWAFGLISIFPVIAWWRRYRFEAERWINSDFSPYRSKSSGDDDEEEEES
jgi:hypothetical protein